MSSVSESLSYRKRLVADLQKAGAIRSVAVAHAFTAIPRERFVPLFYRQQGRAWFPCSEATQGEHWLSCIYQDEALVTLLDAQHIPISSSSMPSLMATMLEELDVHPGMRVFEVGTGTGYNAALLSHLTDDPRLVTSIDVDCDLASQAEQVLHACVGPVKVLVGDGYCLREEQCSERIIATASSPGIPSAWYRQLSGGGRLVMPLMGSLNASGLLILEKQHARGVGHFVPVPLGFMSMRSSAIPAYPTARELFQLPIKGSVSVDEAGDPLLKALTDPGFRWFVEWAWPSEGLLQIVRMTLQNGRRAFQLKDPRQHTILQLTQEPSGKWLGHQRGEFPLWQRLRQYYQKYEQLGCPGKEAYQIVLNGQRACLSVSTAHEQIALRENLWCN